MVFCLVDCLPSEHPMNSTSTNEGGYEESDLRKKLNGEILNLFPAELKAMMTPFDNGDLLRLPTEKEIFGENYYGEYESPYVKQWKPMKKRRNRIDDKDYTTFSIANDPEAVKYLKAPLKNGGYSFEERKAFWNSFFDFKAPKLRLPVKIAKRSGCKL